MYFPIPENETTMEAADALRLEGGIIGDLLLIARSALENAPSDLTGSMVNMLYLLSLLQERQSARVERWAAELLRREEGKR